MQNTIIKTCTQLEAAEIQARLEAEGIPVVVFNGSESFVTSVAGGPPQVQIGVRAADQARALEILGLAAPGAAERHSMAEVTARVEQGLRRGEPSTEIVAQLVEWGWPEVTAQNFVQARQRQLATRRSAPQPATQQPAAYLRQMLSGLAWFIGGAALTWLGLRSSSGGFIFFGAILFGLYQFISGLLGWWRSRN